MDFLSIHKLVLLIKAHHSSQFFYYRLLVLNQGLRPSSAQMLLRKASAYLGSF